MILVTKCSDRHHSFPCVNSPYPKDRVPIILFYKDPNNLESKIFKTCFHCRNYVKKNKKNRNIKNQGNNEIKDDEIKDDEIKETRECFCKNHDNSCIGSPYKKSSVPKNMFFKIPENPTGKEFKYCYHCREYKQKIDEKKRKEKLESFETTEDSSFSICANKDHGLNYKYPWNKVPKSQFLKNPEDPNSKIFKTCYECREVRKNRKIKLINKIEEERKNIDEKFWVCSHRDHNTRSDYPRNQVPIEMFRKDKEDPKSGLFEQCSDCRNISSINSNKIREKIKSSLKEDEFFCEGWCKKPKSLDLRAINLDGSYGSSCFECRERSLEKSRKNQEIRLTIKIEKMIKNSYSCELCKNIYLIPEKNTNHVIELTTYEKDNIRYVNYKNQSYVAVTFMDKYKEYLETRILHFDHLTEEEQRERGIIKENEIYVGKKGNVAQMTNFSSIVREIEKTQLICNRCHVKETMRREKGNNIRSGLIKQKKDYMNKMREKGCSVCGFYDKELLKFLYFDHINPENKRCNVSKMAVDPNYTLKDIIEECNVTRILCKHCHAVHTSIQQGWFYSLYN